MYLFLGFLVLFHSMLKRERANNKQKNLKLRVTTTYASTLAFSQKRKIVCETYFRGKLSAKFRILKNGQFGDLWKFGTPRSAQICNV